MFRKTNAFILILLFLPALLFAVANFWVLDQTDWLNTGAKTDYYRFNYQTVLNLDQEFKQPTYSTDHYNNEQYISKNNAIASIGVSGCNHRIIYTINTNGGTFVSQSDSSKYREYYVVASPDYTKYNNVNVNNPTYNDVPNGTSHFPRSYYYYDEATSSLKQTSDYLPNTKNGTSMSLTTPVTDGVTESRYNGSSGWGGTNWSTSTMNAFGYDLFICMDGLEPDDYYHLIESDDYLATITIKWDCEQNCPEHHGSFTIIVRGYIDHNSGNGTDTVFLVVEPTADSMSLNLKEMILSNDPAITEKTIAKLTVDTTTVRKNKNNNSDVSWKWRERVKVFLSASPDYNSSGNSFLLWNIRNNTITIPFEITVYNDSDNTDQTYSTYYGTDSISTNNFLDLRDLTKSSTDYYSVFTDRYLQDYYAINYSGTVKISVDGTKTVSVNNTEVSIATILSDPTTYRTKYYTFVGNYQSYIYYHIVTDN